MNATLKLTLTAGLLAGSSLALPFDRAQAGEVIFGSTNLRGQAIEPGRRLVLAGGVTQIRLDGGAVASFVGAAEFAIRDADAIELQSGTVTVTSQTGKAVVVHMPNGVEGRLDGAGAASFTAAADGARGHVMTGNAVVTGRSGRTSYAGGQFWRVDARGEPSRAVANAEGAPAPVLASGQPVATAIRVTDAVAVPDLRAGGPVAAVVAGLPTGLGEALAANGASGDIVSAANAVEASVANPSLTSFPVGDYGALVAYAARLSAPLGGQAFPGAGPDIVRTYLEYLSKGGARESFLQGYAALLVQYLDLMRGGALPSSFQGASVRQINDFLAYQARTSGFAGLSAENRVLLDAYRGFLAGGGNADQFTRRYTDLAKAYFDFLLAGGSPAEFTGASQQTVNAYLAFLRDARLTGALSPANRALLTAYLDGLANGSNGLAFVDQYRSALGAYFDYLKAGNLPSSYVALSPATLRAYLDTLAQAGLLDGVLGSQAAFYRAYLDHLNAGGAIDAWTALPANQFTGYAGALAAFEAYLKGGNLPSAYGAVPVATLKAYLEALSAAGALDRFLGSDAGFFRDYLAHLAAGGTTDGWAGLPVNVYAGYADALSAYAAYLKGGNLPSAYGVLPAETLAAYLDALKAAGVFDRLLAQQAQFFDAYLAHLKAGGGVDGWQGLPANLYSGYAAALGAYLDYLKTGGIPSAYGVLTAAQIADYLDALTAAGVFDRFLGGEASFWTGYRSYVVGGGNPDAYPNLPAPIDFDAYAGTVNAFAAYLRGGGLPGGYGAADAATLQRYLAALKGAGLLSDTLLSAYLDHVAAGGAPGSFAGAPVYGSYAAALQSYYAHLAGGGLPSGYAALSAAQVRDYLSVLASAGLLQGLLGGDAAFLSAYLTHIEAGKSPDLFPGLPVFDGYRSAGLAFLAYVENDGLPSNYGALPSGQLLAYLTALRDAGLLEQTLAGAGGASAYVTHLLAGGAPDGFAGLPVFEGYKTALLAYFDYISGGGKPSLYTAASQGTLIGYIRKLDAAGVLAASLDADDRQLLLDYAAWVDGGSNPDLFPGLPQAPLTPLPAPAFTYSGGFTPNANTSYKAITPSAAGQRLFTSQNNGSQVVVNAQGQATQLASLIRTSGAQVKDAAGNANVVVGRWTAGAYTVGNPVFNPTGAQSLHYYAAAPASFTAPAAGRIDYEILAATQPTYESGYGAAGLFDADLSIDFATRKAGIAGTIRMPERGGPISYAFTTPGGAATPSETLTLGTLSQLSIIAAMTGEGRGCGGSCSLRFEGGFGGSSPETVGFVYYSLGTGVDPIMGAVAFTGDYVAPQNPLPDPNHGYVAGLPGTGIRHMLSGVRVTGSSNGQLFSQVRNGTATIQPDGGVTAIGIANGQQAGITVTRDQAKSSDVAGNARIVVGRWSDGRYVPSGNGSFATTLTANTGMHYVLGLTPDFIIPYMGRVDYTLLAATRPTYVGGGTMPGLFDAAMSIAFASQPKIGITGTIRMPEASGIATYSFTTPGGNTNPNSSFQFNPDSSFSFSAPLQGSGAACGTACTIGFAGTLTGNDPLAIGVTYSTSQQNGSPDAVIHGAAAFTGNWVGAPQTLTRVTDRTLFAYTGTNSALSPNNSGASYDLNPAGQVIGMTSFNGLHDRLGTATIAESGSLAGNLVGWTRWTSGQLDIARFGPSSVVLGANDSYQIMHGQPLSNMPTSGTASYTVGGGTQVADNLGAVAAGGTTTGTAKVMFGSTVKVGFDITTQFNGSSYNLWTTGRTGDVSASELTVGTDGRFNSIGPNGNATGTGCAGNACRPIWNGFLAGSGAAGIGLHFRVQNTVQRNLDFHGIAAFTKDGAAAGAPPQAALAWPTAPDVPGVSANATPSSIDMATMRDQASKLLGGNIRF
ncbi:MAG: hypothetical protein ACO1O3_22060 [Sphingobium sp.]